MIRRRTRSFAAAAVALSIFAVLSGSVQAQGGSNGAQHPFSAPDATVHYAPDRRFDLKNLAIDITIDYPNRSFVGKATNTLTALRDDLTFFKFHVGKFTVVDGVTLDGAPAKFKKVADGIEVDTPPTKVGIKSEVAISYHFKQSDANGGGELGVRWISDSPDDPGRAQFYTNGETEENRDWAPTWDYPNDFTTTQTTCTVPADWEVIGNGVQVSDRVSEDKKTRTVVWRMDIPHATYLVSLAAGRFDIKKDKWRGVDLWYVVPRGRGRLIDYTFEDTKDMLSFYSDTLGFKYPWPKYAQDCMWNFGGGQENVSATTLGAEFLTDKRQGIHDMDSLTSHEMGHQWFGDTVTCKNWGEIWLNESFATYMQMMYFQHSQGTWSYQREIESNSQGYFQESRRYERPMVTDFYSDPGVMFDQHTYPKGGVLLHSLRRWLGDKPFFAGLHKYLVDNQHTPVETPKLCDALTEASGINCHPWFDQWIYKPGHPVIDWSWTYDDAKKQVVVDVKQVQNTANGTPIYTAPLKIGLLKGGIDRRSVELNAADQRFVFPVDARPDAVVFDPDHDFLRQIRRQPWKGDELVSVMRYAPNCIDRVNAMNQILGGSPSDSDVQAVVDVLKADTSAFPAFTNDRNLADLKRPDLVPFFETELKHANYTRRSAAVRALGLLPNGPETNRLLTSMIDNQQPYAVVTAAMNSMIERDLPAATPAIEREAKTEDNLPLRRLALITLAKAGDRSAADLIFASTAPNQPTSIRTAGYAALPELQGEDPRLLPTLRAGLDQKVFGILQGTLETIGKRKLREFLPRLEELKKERPNDDFYFDATIDEIGK